jgi:hypothetical protein
MAAKTTATAVTATSISSFNLGTAITYAVAVNTGTAVADTEFYEIAVTKAEPRGVIILTNFNATTASTLKYTVVAPTGTSKYWASGSDTTEATISGGVVGGGSSVAINIEGAKYTNTSGKIRVNLVLGAITTGGLAAVSKVAYVQLP